MIKSISILFVLMSWISVLNADFIRDDDKYVVIDTSTQLMWQDNSDAKTLTKNWDDALAYCEALTLGPYNDWRLPNFNELYLLADRSIISSPAISSVFTNVFSSNYWSSTTNASNTSNAWNVNFNKGNDNWNDKTNSNYVRCVR